MGGLSELKCLQKSNFRMRMLKPSICDNKNVDESPPPDPHGGRLLPPDASSASLRLGDGRRHRLPRPRPAAVVRRKERGEEEWGRREWGEEDLVGETR